MPTKDELYTFAMELFETAKNELTRDGSVMHQHILLKRDDTKLCLLVASCHTQDHKDMIARQLKAVAPACKAVGTIFEAWMAENSDGNTPPSSDPNRFEAIWVSVQSEEGTWCLTSKFGRDPRGKPCTPSHPEAAWNTLQDGRYANLYG